MTEGLCPKCNNANPAEAEVCQFCGTSLLSSGGTGSSNASPRPKEQSQVTKDWLAGLNQGDEEKEEVPEWLAGIRSKISQSEESLPIEDSPAQQQEITPLQQEKSLASAEGTSSGLSDWLSGLDKGQDTSSPQKEDEQAEESDKWMDGLQDTSRKDEAPESRVETSQPEWLSSLREDTSSSESNQGTPPVETPGWLSGISADPSSRGNGESKAPPPAKVPDWLDQSPAEPPADETKPASKPFPTGTLPSDEGGQPDWLSNLQADAIQEPPSEGFTSTSGLAKEEIPTEALPDWLSEIGETESTPGGPPALIQSGSPSPSESETSGMFSMEEQPAWLSNLKPEESQKAVPAGNKESDQPDQIEKAEIPTWIKGMRPVESVVADVQSAPIDSDLPPEQSGPLAGLQGVLPAIGGLGPLLKPPAYSIKLRIDETQQQHAAQLENIIANEAEPQAVKKQGFLRSASLLRWIIALALIIITGVTVVTRLQVLPESTLYPPEMISAMDVISGLESNSPVLVIFDYQPALSGELEAAAAPMIDNLLLLKGSRLVFLSTSPTGPALAERFMLNTQAGHNYQPGQQYINLGYLPGGPAGMLSFAQNPRATLPYSTGGQPAWQTPPLQGVNSFSDFSAVIVLIDDPDIARTWIEQTGGYSDQTPMLMVISAQAEPIIRPYFDSGQIKGLVTGLSGGQAYAYAIQRDGPAGQYWNAFSTGMLTAEIVIILGTCWSVLTSLRERRKVKEEESQ